MVEYRQLNDDERRLCERQLERLSEELKYLNNSMDYLDFMLEKGIETQMYNMRKMKETEKKQLDMEIKNMANTVMVLNDQLTTGVVQKGNEEKEVSE